VRDGGGRRGALRRNGPGAWLRRWLFVALALAASEASATFQSWRIEQVYSNADGTVQYVVLHESQGLAGERFLAGRMLTSTHGGVTRTFAFPADIPSSLTANKRLLIGTQGLAALNLIVPDYVVPNGFLATDGATLDYAGVDQIVYASLPTDGGTAIGRTGTGMPSVATNFAGASAVLPALPVVLVEFYNAGLDHYFISDLQPDIEALDSGHFPGWTRTGLSFKVFPGQASGGAGVNPVCRFYIPPDKGNSHFFSASPAECAAVDQLRLTDPAYAGYVFESPNAFYIALPNTANGACPGGTTPVYRLWNGRIDSNHRYTADPGIRAAMIAKSYVPEGYGPNAVIMCAPAPGTATLQFQNVAGAPVGALVRDGAGVPAANYQGYPTNADAVTVGPRVATGEVIAFGHERAVSVQPVSWTTAMGDQTVMVPLATRLEVPVTIWVVAAPFATMQQTALTMWQTAQQIFADERFGVSLAPLEIVDATANPKAATWNAFVCGTNPTNALNVPAIQADIGVRAGRINVYLVNLVDGSTSRGNACAAGGGFVAIAGGGGAELLAHELGHDFALDHIDDLVLSFDVHNVMYSASSVRQFVTEGQSFRAHTRPNSALNAVYAVRAGQPTRSCDRDTPTIDCPVIYKRLWADGLYGPN